jgi:hypothetical protein
LLVLDFELANALLLGCQWFANTWLSKLLGIELGKPASDSRFAQFHVPADFADAEVLMADHLNDLQLEAGVKDSSFLFRHGDCPGDFHLSWCAKKLEQDKVTGLVKVNPAYAALIPEGETLGPIYKFQGVGFTVDRANVLLQGEYVRRSASQLNEFVAGDASYLMVGYRFGRFIPFASVAEVKAKDDSNTAPQTTKAIGLRWDAFSSAAIKFQVERVDAKGSYGTSFIKYSTDPKVGSFPNITKPVTTFSVAVDFVF